MFSIFKERKSFAYLYKHTEVSIKFNAFQIWMKQILSCWIVAPKVSEVVHLFSILPFIMPFIMLSWSTEKKKSLPFLFKDKLLFI